MVDDATFWNRWNSPATVYALTDRAAYDQLRIESKRTPYLIAQTAYDVLLSNVSGHHGAPAKIP